jgi:hypothetical protein
MTEWLTKHQAAAQLKISLRTVLDLAARKKLITKREKGASNQIETFFSAADVERYGYEREHPEEKQKPAPVNGLVRQNPMDAVVAMAVEAYKLPKFAATVTHSWLTLKEAAEVSGLPSVFLGQLIEKGKLPVIRIPGTEGAKLTKKGKFFKYRVSKRDLDSIQGEVICK